MNKPHAPPTYRRAHVCLPLPVAARLDRIRALLGVDGARLPESSLITSLVARGLSALEAEHRLPPIEAPASTP